MSPGIPSRTALGLARHRAAHQVLDHPIVFRDPLAEKIVGSEERFSRNSPGSRLLRVFIAARSRYAEDELAAFFTRGVRQYVVLGAGLDTFTYRHPYAPELKVFEVDHPDTQAWKIERLRAACIPIPDSLQFVPVNFEHERLIQALENAQGFNVAAPAFFSLLGVTPYLTKDPLLSTLAAIASMPAGTGVVFDYVIPAACLSLLDKIGLQMLSARVAKLGEVFRLFLEPDEISATLRNLGFAHLEDLGQHEINSRYFQNWSGGLRIGSAAGRILSATVVR